MMAGLNIVVVPAGPATTLPPRLRMTSLLANASRMASARLMSIASWSPRILRGARWLRWKPGPDRWWFPRPGTRSESQWPRADRLDARENETPGGGYQHPAVLSSSPISAMAIQRRQFIAGRSRLLLWFGRAIYGDGARHLDVRTIATSALTAIDGRYCTTGAISPAGIFGTGGLRVPSDVPAAGLDRRTDLQVRPGDPERLCRLRRPDPAADRDAPDATGSGRSSPPRSRPPQARHRFAAEDAAATAGAAAGAIVSQRAARDAVDSRSSRTAAPGT